MVSESLVQKTVPPTMRSGGTGTAKTVKQNS